MADKPASQRQPTLDDDAFFRGILWGMVLGALWTFFNYSRTGPETRQRLAESLRQRSDAQDPVAASLAEGKAAARQRRDALTQSQET